MTRHPSALISSFAQIDNSVEIGAFCVIGPNVKIGQGTKLLSHVIIEENTEIGDNCVIHPFCVLGGVPQSTGYKGEETKLIIGNNNIFREGITINRGTMQGGGITKIGHNGFFMTQCHIAHDCIIGDNVIFVNNVGLAGHAIIGNNTFLSGFTTVHQFTRIGDYAMTGAVSFVKHDVIPFGMTGGAEYTGAKLIGLNFVGMKRRGFSKEEIKQVHGCYKSVFFGEGTFDARIKLAKTLYEQMEKPNLILKFLDANVKRPIMMARDKAAD